MGVNITAQKIKLLNKTYSEGNLPTTNMNSILDYVRSRKNEGLSDDTTANDLKAIIEFSKEVKKPFEEINQSDLYTFFDYLNDRISPSTVRLQKIKLRIFFRHIGRNDLADLCTARQGKATAKLPEDLLTLEDIEKLIDAAQNLRDKAFIAFLYESGARRGEIFSIQIKHVVFDADGAVVTLPKGKTGARRIRVVFSTGYLRNWLDNHPDKANRDAPLWASLKYQGKMLEYHTAQDNLKKFAKKAGIQKPVNLHFFRHVRASHLAKDLTEQQLKIYLGWSAGSSMAATYVHLSGKDVDEAILRHNGIEKPRGETHSNSLKTIRCPRCKELQDSKSSYCFKCAMPLTLEAQKTEKSTEDIMKQLLSDPEIMNIIVQQVQAKTG